MSELVIGVDGGGTKTVAWLATVGSADSSEVLGRGIAGPGNPRAVGFDAAQVNIEAAIEAAFADAKSPRRPTAAACLALAGAGRPDEQQRIAAWASGRAIARQVIVCGDAEPILAAASSENVGVVLIAGTGSLAWGRNAAGKTARTGGWGYLLGDEGSGYSIALAGLRAAVRAADGREPATVLLPRFLQALSIAQPEDLIAAVYSPEMTRRRVAELAGVVFESATIDAAAESIVEQAVSELAGHVATLVSQLWHPGANYMVALAGGLLLNQRDYREQVTRKIEQELVKHKLPRAAEFKAVNDPVRGSVELARRMVRPLRSEYRESQP